MGTVRSPSGIVVRVEAKNDGLDTSSVDIPYSPPPPGTPFFTTPRFPEYPSGHGGHPGAAQAVLAAFVGPNAPKPSAVTSPTHPGVTHPYVNWSQVTREVVNARVWEGVHFRFSDNTGAAEGAQVAGYDLARLHSIGL